MFIEQGIKPDNKFWRYLVGSIVVVGASFVGQIPLILVILGESVSSGRPFPATNRDITGFLDLNLTLFLVLLSFVFALAALFIVLRVIHRQSVLSITTSRPKPDYSRMAFAFFVWAAISVVSVAVSYLISPEDFVFNFKPIPFAILVMVAVVLIPIQTSTEEFVFRGYLMQGFANLSMNRWFPLVMTSLIFGLMHIFNPEVGRMGYLILVYYIGTGLFLGIITLMDQGLELALGFHAANNLVGAVLITADWSAFQTHSLFKDISEPSAGLEVIFPVFVIFPLLLFIFSHKYNWTDWKDKLTGRVAPKSHSDASNFTQPDV
jgi:uncharacterized protein